VRLFGQLRAVPDADDPDGASFQTIEGPLWGDDLLQEDVGFCKDRLEIVPFAWKEPHRSPNSLEGHR
jgi:hypothetical protein